MNKHYLIGKDTGLSYSPFIHKWVFNKYNIKSDYINFNIDSYEALVEWLTRLKINNIIGFNITNPYKEIIIPYLNSIDDISNNIGSVNCVKINNNYLSGYNTDYYGFIKLLESNKLLLNGKTNLVIGFGGAAKAITHYLSKVDSNTYIIVRNIRTNHKKYNNRFINISSLKNYNFSNFNVINCTPINFIHPASNLYSYLKFNAINWIDLIYNIKTTTLSQKLCSKDNINYVNGLDMLIYQAILSIDIWYETNYEREIEILKLKNDLMKEKYVNKN